MLPKVVCLGVNHRTAPVVVREQVRQLLIDLVVELPAGCEHVLLATCNRVELYLVGKPAGWVTAQLQANWSGDPTQLTNALYQHEGKAVLAHLARVAAGLDSLILGEPQILGQVTTAYNEAIGDDTLGPVLNTVFQAAIRAGKRARTETGISNNPASVSSIAIAQAQAVLGDLTGRSVLVIGVGEMGRLAIKALRARKITQINVANRTYERAAALVAEWGGTAYRLRELATAMAQADVVISATNSPNTVIDEALLAGVMAERQAPMVLIDIAVPRDIDPAVANWPLVHLYGIDQLQASLDEALLARQAAVPTVERILAVEVERGLAQLSLLRVTPLITDLRQKAEAIRQREVARTERYLGELDPTLMEHVHHLSCSLVNKLLHEPTVRLREQAKQGDVATYADTMRILFDL